MCQCYANFYLTGGGGQPVVGGSTGRGARFARAERRRQDNGNQRAYCRARPDPWKGERRPCAASLAKLSR